MGTLAWRIGTISVGLLLIGLVASLPSAEPSAFVCAAGPLFGIVVGVAVAFARNAALRPRTIVKSGIVGSAIGPIVAAGKGMALVGLGGVLGECLVYGAVVGAGAALVLNGLRSQNGGARPGDLHPRPLARHARNTIQRLHPGQMLMVWAGLVGVDWLVAQFILESSAPRGVVRMMAFALVTIPVALVSTTWVWFDGRRHA